MNSEFLESDDIIFYFSYCADFVIYNFLNTFTLHKNLTYYFIDKKGGKSLSSQGFSIKMNYRKLYIFLSSLFLYFASSCHSVKCYNVLCTHIYLHNTFIQLVSNLRIIFRQII
jgi:hypothetical protein